MANFATFSTPLVRTALMVLIAAMRSPVDAAAGNITPIALQFSPNLRPPNGEFWKDVRIPTVDNQGRVTFRALVDANNYDGGVNSAYRSGDDRFIARVGDQAPGAPEGVLFQSLTNLQAGLGGPVAFLGHVGATSAQDPLTQPAGIWAENPGHTLRLIALEGSPAPGAPPGANFGKFPDPVADNRRGAPPPPFTINGQGETAFYAGFVAPDSAISGAGIWSEGGGRGQRLVARTRRRGPSVRSRRRLYRFLRTSFLRFQHFQPCHTP